LKTGFIGDSKLVDVTATLDKAFDAYNFAVASMTLRMVVKVHDFLTSFFSFQCIFDLVAKPELRRIEDTFMVPYERNIHFSGRDDLVEKIEEELRRHESGRLNHRVALYGLGGIGKTQTALEYVYSRRDSGLYNLIYWLSAKDQASLLADYARIASSAGLAIQGLEPKEIAQSVRVWLRGKHDWLVVFDNLDDISVAEDLLPENGMQKHLLITTRNPNTDGIPAEGVEVPLLSEVDSQRLFVSLSSVTPSFAELALIPTIVEDLGCLPLAIEQAASYVKYVARDFITFRDQYRKNHQDVLGWKSRGNRPYPDSVATTWSMSFQVLINNFPISVKLLRLFSFLNPDCILLSFLKDGGRAELDGDFLRLFQTPIELRKAILELEQLSLIKCNRSTDSLTVHRLVQTIVRDEMNSDELWEYSKTVIKICDSNFPDPTPRTKEILDHCRINLGQIMIPINLVYFLWRTNPKAHQPGHRTKESESESEIKDWIIRYYSTVCSYVALFLDMEGGYHDEEIILSQLLEVQVEVLTKDHPATFVSMNNLAGAHHHMGRLDEAAKLHEQALEKRRTTLGEDHPDTLTSMNNLAVSYRRLGRSDEAARINEQVLEKRRTILGKDHPNTLDSMSNLALSYSNLGRWDEAARMDEQVIEKRRAILGEDHPDTLASMSNLAVSYNRLGRLDEAARINEQVLEKRKTILGEDHPDTLTSMNNLAVSYNRLGRLDEAARMDERVFEKRRTTLGEDHPDTLTSMSNLAGSYSRLGRLDEAARMEEQVLEKRRTTLGEDHPDTLTSMNNLAGSYSHLGRLDEAARMDEQVLEKRRTILGEDHPNTLDSMSNLALSYSSLGKFNEAAELLEQVVDKRARVLSRAHPYTIASEAHLRRVRETLEEISRTETSSS
jgi:tetratricopeptide (TPR) repeat protein